MNGLGIDGNFLQIPIGQREEKNQRRRGIVIVQSGIRDPDLDEKGYIELAVLLRIRKPCIKVWLADQVSDDEEA